MHPMILIQLRMKRQRHLLPIPNRHNPILYYSQYLNSIRNIRHIRRPDKRHRNLPNSFKLCFRVKTPQLPSISIPLHRHRNRLKMHHRIPLQRIRQKNHPRTGSQNRKPLLNLLPDRIKHPKLPSKLPLYRTFAAGKNQPVIRLVQILRLAKLHTGSPKHFQFPLVLDKSSLYGKNCNFHLIFPFPPSEAESQIR